MHTRLIAITAGLAASSIAAAQSQFSLVSWFASLDNGQTWQGGTVEVADPFARIRIRASVDWEYPGSYALARCLMDVTIADAGPGDQVLDYGRIAPFNSPGGQQLAVMRFGNLIKIDDVRDTFSPGGGQHSIWCTQPAEMFGFPFSTERPALIFQFALQLDGTHGTRIVRQVHPTSATGAVGYPTVYLNPQGMGAEPQPALTAPLNLVVIPAPGALGLGVLALLALRRREGRSVVSAAAGGGGGGVEGGIGGKEDAEGRAAAGCGVE